ncbi:MAG: hypothetical protein H0T46_32540 [Deltaproteobacteria bacterium]|nr:hypothetical protein [Deltaproteobacteria bacterium]
MTMDVDPSAWHRVSQVALEAAHGDERTALALLQGCYVEMASRLVVTEHASASWLDAISMFCQVASDRLSDEASYFVGATRSTESDRLGKLAGSHEEATRVAMQLRARFETFEHTRSPLSESATDEHVALGDHA